MATDEVSAAVRDSATAEVALAPASKCGAWISITPHTPQIDAIQTDKVGRTRKSGQDSSATQMGSVFVSVITSEVGNCASAKNVQSRLMLLAQPRSHNAYGRQKTRLAPENRAKRKARTKAILLRASATTRQSQVSFRRWANSPIQAVKKQPPSIHKYGANDQFRLAGIVHLRTGRIDLVRKEIRIIDQESGSAFFLSRA